jgi:hypothetical protein
MIEIKMMLSTPRTISKKVSVSKLMMLFASKSAEKSISVFSKSVYNLDFAAKLSQIFSVLAKNIKTKAAHMISCERLFFEKLPLTH